MKEESIECCFLLVSIEIGSLFLFFVGHDGFGAMSVALLLFCFSCSLDLYIDTYTLAWRVGKGGRVDYT